VCTFDYHKEFVEKKELEALKEVKINYSRLTGGPEKLE